MITEETPGPGSTLGEAETTRAGPAQPNSVFEDVEPLRHQPWRSIDGAAGRLLLSTISGALLGAAFPKIGLGGLAWIALVPLLFGIERRSLSKVFGYAWISGTAFFAVSLYWIATALIAESHSSLSVALIAVLAISVFEGVFIAVAIWAAEFVSRQLGISRLLSFPLAWTSFEWLRSWFPVAFPWNPLGNAIYRELPMIQIAEVVGVFGVSALLVAVNVAIWIACSRVAQASACDLRVWIQRLGDRWWLERREEPNPQPLPWEGRGVGIEAGTSDLTPRPPVPRERGEFFGESQAEACATWGRWVSSRCVGKHICVRGFQDSSVRPSARGRTYQSRDGAGEYPAAR